MAISQFLLFCLGIGVLWGIAPAVVWMASGSRRQAWEAFKGYGWFLAFIAASMAVGAIIGLADRFMS